MSYYFSYLYVGFFLFPGKIFTVFMSFILVRVIKIKWTTNTTLWFNETVTIEYFIFHYVYTFIVGS